ncbi:alpha/beta hydrolase [Pendulispora rubella]|uniref:Alpha/beta hydrolase n=1 Tax=Pendulispora rubella TaxID=2741070 RepID=A0ABZ2LKX7_9BACT
MTAITISGTTVSYTKVGKGPGLVLVHGTSLDGTSNFAHIVPRFSDARTVVALDYAGAGASTIPEGDLTLDLLVDQVAGAIRHASDGPVDLLGDSLGAVVAAATAARHPALVRRLVLVAGWAYSGDPRHQLMFGTWARLEGLDSELGNRFGMAMALRPEFLTALGHENIARALMQKTPPNTLRRIELGLRVDIRDEAKKIVAPTLIIQGTDDYLVPEYQSRALRESIDGSRYASVESGHGIFFEKADDVVALARTFLFDSIPASNQ